MATNKELLQALKACQKAMAIGRPAIPSHCPLWLEAVAMTEAILGEVDFDDVYDDLMQAEENRHYQTLDL